MKSGVVKYLILSLFILLLSVFNIGVKSFVSTKYLQFITPSAVSGQKIYNNYANFSLALQRSAMLDEKEQQIVSLSELVADYESVKEENKLLKETLGVKTLSFEKKQLVIAQLVFIDTTKSVATAVVSSDSSDNIKVGSPVIYSNSLVGVVSEINKNRVLVNLISNKDFVTEAVDIVTGANGVVRGAFLGITFSDVLNSETLNLGDIIATSGSSGKFENSYVLGKVSDVKSTEGEPFQTATVVSLINVHKLNKVLIVVEK